MADRGQYAAFFSWHAKCKGLFREAPARPPHWVATAGGRRAGVADGSGRRDGANGLGVEALYS